MVQAIIGGSVIDGTGQDPITRGVVIVDRGRIVAVGPEASVSIPRDAEIFDAGGLTVLPGFIDCHLHCTYRARDIRNHLLNPPTYNIFRSISILRDTLDCGVTTARDMGGADPGFRKAIEEKLIAGPWLLVSTAMISQTGGHGDCWVPADVRVPRRSWLPKNIADGVDQVRKLARKLLMAGADFLKICTTGGITSVTDDYDEPQFTVAEIQAAVYEAAVRKKRVAAHAEGGTGIKNALQAGVYSIEHGWFMDEQCVDTMIEHGTWWIPTLALVPLSRERRMKDKTWDAGQLAMEDVKEEEIYKRQLAQIPLWRHAVSRGLKIAMGSDQSHRLLTGKNLVELEFMVKTLGMSPMQAIMASTRVAAECLERPELGSLTPGKVGDVVIVDGNPLDDISVLGNTARIRLVMKGGVPYRNEIDRRARPAQASANSMVGMRPVPR